MALISKWFTSLTLHIHRLVTTTILPAAAPPPSSPPPSLLRQLGKNAFVVDADALLLNMPSSPSPSPGAAFPAYFLAAVEAGSFARGLVLLALYPILLALPLPRDARVKAMAMVAFCGLRRDAAARVGRAVLPKLFSRACTPPPAAVEALLLRASPEEEEATVVVVAVSRTFPTVMVEPFLKEYVGFDAVAGRELRGGPRYLTGAMAAAAELELDAESVARDVVQERTEKTTTTTTSYSAGGGGGHGHGPWRLKPVVFHDGRLAFTPAAAAALAMYVYLPLGAVLAVVRIAIYVLLPWRVSAAVAALTGVRLRVVVVTTGGKPHHPRHGGGGRLYASNHRTLLDSVAMASALGRPVAAVSYGLGRLSELLSPIPQRRLTRDREEDRRRMSAMLSGGDDMVVCPEGTTCREPYLLRFSPLFAELAAEVVPVAVDARTSVFYATSASSPLAKSLDSVYFLMNPRPEYSVQFLPPVSTTNKSSIEVANEVQRAIAAALGFEATALTRKDKYLLLAGNEGIVKSKY